MVVALVMVQDMPFAIVATTEAKTMEEQVVFW